MLRSVFSNRVSTWLTQLPAPRQHETMLEDFCEPAWLLAWLFLMNSKDENIPLGLSLCVLAIFVEAEWVNLRCCCKPQILASEGIFVRHQIWLHHTYPAHWRSTVTVSTDWTHHYTQHAVHYNIFRVESLVFWFHRCSPLKKFCEWQQAPCQRAWRYNNFKTMTHFTLITRLRWIYWWHIPWSIHCKLIEDLVPVYRIDLHRIFKFDAESSKWWKATYRLSSTKWLL